MSAAESSRRRNRLRRQVYSTLEPSVSTSAGHPAWGPFRIDLALVAESTLVSVIIVNSMALILWTVPHLAASYGYWFHVIEYCTVTVFLVEYALRFWTAPESAPDPELAGWPPRWRYLVSPYALVDAAALAPSGIAAVLLLVGGDGPSLSFLLTVRLLTRTLKLARYFPAARRLALTVRQKSGQLLTIVVALIVALVIAATLMYFAETEAQPEVFSSIPASMWWSVVTLTTVGYGDTVPITPTGRLLAAVIAVLGIGLFALPAGIISAGLLEVDVAKDGAGLERVPRRSPGELCPHCGQPIPDDPDAARS